MGLGPFGAFAALFLISAMVVAFLIFLIKCHFLKKEKKILLDSFRSVFIQLPLELLRKGIAIPYINGDETSMHDVIEEIRREVIKEKEEAAKK
ncbi:MAG: hypothetical protein WC878_05390 [Candidatus Paceibacterota bacterium]|jgi:hypothetical protein